MDYAFVFVTAILALFFFTVKRYLCLNSGENSSLLLKFFGNLLVFIHMF